MKKLNIVESKTCLLLVTAILILCAGFFIVGCGVGPATKAVNPNQGSFALDFTDCPGATSTSATCLAAFTTPTFDTNLFQAKPLTFEAWVKPKATSSGTFLDRMSVARGAKLHGSSTATAITPQFSIRRTVLSPSGSGTPPTSTATYTVTSLSTIALNVWAHVAGILSNSVHTGVHAACTDATGAEADSWHLDIYVNGVYSDCTETWNGTTGAGDADPTTAANAYAHEPVAHTSGPGKFFGVLDEARVWNVARTAAEIVTCKGVELGVSGTCNRGDNALITYHMFNAGSGYSVVDMSGTIGTGTKEYPDPSNVGEFLHWTTGWTTDIPFQ